MQEKRGPFSFIVILVAGQDPIRFLSRFVKESNHMKWTEPAYAKLNLTLDILSRLPNGYHSLAMVMQSVSLHDTVILTLAEPGAGIRVECGEGAPTGKENIVWKAADAFFRYCGRKTEDVCFHIEKHTPSQAGMGGGSSDAAAALRLLNRVFHAGLTVQELRTIGAGVGADVPFCITGGTMQAEGIGEVLTPVTPLPSCGILLCKPPIGVSTPEAFRLSDSAPAVEPHTPAMVQALATGHLPIIARCLHNRFQEILQLPQITAIVDAMKKENALGACMTGSGSVVFGLFPSEKEAQQAAKAVSPMGQVFVAHPIEEEKIEEME